MKAMTRGLLTLSLLAAVACDGAPTASNALVSPGDTGPAFSNHQSSSTLTFAYTQSGSTQTPQSSSGGVGRIDFAGSLTTGTPCYDVTASHSEKRSSVTVTVTATDAGGICTQVITHNNYTGAVSGLAAGTYTFTVKHSQGGASTTVHTNTVVVQ